eukprot:2007589-Amphidinium_carterae.1
MYMLLEDRSALCHRDPSSKTGACVLRGKGFITRICKRDSKVCSAHVATCDYLPSYCGAVHPCKLLSSACVMRVARVPEEIDPLQLFNGLFLSLACACFVIKVVQHESCAMRKTCDNKGSTNDKGPGFCDFP